MKNINVKYQNGNYNICIKENILNEIVNYLKNNFKDKKITVITDNNLQRIYGEVIKKTIKKNEFECHIIKIIPGEESKSLDTLKYIYKKLSDFKMTREDVIITFGGGVVGDTGGFAAATYLRGVRYIEVPTSLLAQVDSSIGGKVAIDMPWGKNLAGSFYNPSAVFIDPKFLNTLEKRYLHDGLAEVIKYGCISGKSIIEKLLAFKNDEELLESIEDIIYTCCTIKKHAVEADEKDFGERMLLNFGHTLGHAIERYFEYKKYTHGEAVGIGMVTITRKSENIGITEKGTSDVIEKVLKKYELPYEMPHADRKSILDAVAIDKKNSGNSIKLILLKKLGEAFIKKVRIDEAEQYI